VVLHLIGCAARYRVAKTHRMPYLYRSFSAKEPPIIGLFCGKWPVKIRHPVGLRHPVMQPDNIASTHGGHQTVKYLDLKIWWFSCGIFCVTGTPFTHVKTCMQIWGLPRKRLWCVRGLPWKFVGKFWWSWLFKVRSLPSVALVLYDLRDRAVDPTVEWLRLVGSLKLQVSFAKEPYKRDDIL